MREEYKDWYGKNDLKQECCASFESEISNITCEE
jgi:hypothetical protein